MNQINVIPQENIGFDYDLYENSSLFSKIFFLYGYNILKIAKKYKLKIKHLIKVNDNNNCKNYFKEIESFREEKNYKKNALLLTFLRLNLLKIILIFIFSSFNSISEYFQILLIKGYIDYFDSKKHF